MSYYLQEAERLLGAARLCLTNDGAPGHEEVVFTVRQAEAQLERLVKRQAAAQSAPEEGKRDYGR